MILSNRNLTDNMQATIFKKKIKVFVKYSMHTERNDDP